MFQKIGQNNVPKIGKINNTFFTNQIAWNVELMKLGFRN